MKKLFGIIVAILVLAVAAYAGTAYWLGQQAEHWYREALAEVANNPNIKLDITRYQRGVFSSQAETRIQIVLPQGQDSDPAQPNPSFSVRQEIYHGPLPLAGWGVPNVPMVWSGAVERDTLDANSSDWTRALARWYGHQEPMLSISRIGFDGTIDSHVTMPPLKLDQIEDLQNLDFSGLNARFRIASHNTAVEAQIIVPHLEVAGKPAEPGTDQPAGIGKISLRDLTATVNQRKGDFGLMFGESSLKVSELRGQDPQAAALFSIDNLSATANLSQSSPQQVASEMVLTADKFTVGKESGKGSVRIALRQLDGPTAAQIEQWQAKTAGSPDDPQALDELLKLMKALLVGKPEFLLDTQATLTQGEWKGQLTLNFQDPGTIDLTRDPMSVLGILEKGLADITVSKPLLETVLADLTKEELLAQLKDQGQEVGEQAVRALAQQQATQQLQELVAANLIRLEGDRYLSTARFENAKLLVNDREIPLAPPTADDQSMEGETMPMEPGGSLLQEEQPLPDSNGGEDTTEVETMPLEPDGGIQEQQAPSPSDDNSGQTPQKQAPRQGASKEGTVGKP